MPHHSNRSDKERLDWLERQSAGPLTITRTDLTFGSPPHYVHGSNMIRVLIDAAMDLDDAYQRRAMEVDKDYHNKLPNQERGTKRYEGED